MEYLKIFLEDYSKIEIVLDIHNNPIGNKGIKKLVENLNILMEDNYYKDINLSNTLIFDESVQLLINNMWRIRECNTINLKGNIISFNILKSICSKSLENIDYPFIEMRYSKWSNKELYYYLNYCIRKKRKHLIISNLNINDSHISLIKNIEYYRLDLSNNRITSKGLKELTNCLPKYANYIAIYNNAIGDEGVEIICNNLDKFIEKKPNYDIGSLNLSNIGMSEKGLTILIERLKGYKQLKRIDISGNVLDEKELRIMKENQEVFDCLDELSLTVKDNIDKSELKSFLETFLSIERMKIEGILEEEKKELFKEFWDIK